MPPSSAGGDMTKGRSASGCWLPTWSGRHINTLEPRAVLLAHHVLVRTENTTVVAYINHQGGLRSYRLNLMARELLWAQGHLASLHAAHLPAILNVAVDMLPREGPPPWDWSLHPQVVQHL